MNDTNTYLKSESEEMSDVDGTVPSNRKRLVTKGIIVSFVILCVVLIASVQGVYSYVSDLLTQTSFAHMTGSGEIYDLDRSSQRAYARTLEKRLDGLRANVSSEIDRLVERRVNEVFDELESGVDEYLDWYFSAPGSYLRLYAAVTQDLEDWSKEQLQNRLVEDSGFAESLAAFEKEFGQIHDELMTRELAETQTLLDEFLETHGTRKTSESLTPEDPVLNFASVIDPSSADLDFERFRNSLMLGGGQGFVAGAAAYGGVRAAAVFVRQFLSKVAGHGARAAAIGAASAAATSISGPVSIGVGVAAAGVSIAAFVGTEYVALNAQETLYRPQMEEDLREYIGIQREEMISQLKGNSEKALQATVQAIQHEIGDQEKAAGISKSYRVWGGRS